MKSAFDSNVKCYFSGNKIKIINVQYVICTLRHAQKSQMFDIFQVFKSLPIINYFFEEVTPS